MKRSPTQARSLATRCPIPIEILSKQLPIALPLPTSPAQQGLMSLIPSPSSADTRAGSALSTNSAHISNSKPHGQQQNYLRIRQKQIGILGQDRDSLKTDDDASWLDNEECEDVFVEGGDDNGPSSPKTVSLDLLSTPATHALTRR
jgi:hypothetical protein